MAYSLSFQGTKFHQATQVCHHESAVKCEGSEAVGEKNSQFSEASTKFFSPPENSIDAISKLEDPIRFKREKLTEQKKLSDKRKAKLNAGEEKTKIQIIKKKKNKPWTRNKHLRKTLDKKENVMESNKKPTNNPPVEEVDPDDRVLVHNCRDSKSLCKSSKLRKEEIGENIRLPASASNPASQGDNKDNKKRTLAVVDKKDDASIGRLENVRLPQPSLLIPNLVNDTSSKLSEDPTIEKPIKSDSDDLQNTTESVGPRGSQPHQQQIKSELPKLNLRTRPLDKIPFSRVVAAQKKINGQFSPYISFPDLLSNLTKSQRSVR